jgi:spermidine/putrescine transport system substrate-binding protein
LHIFNWTTYIAEDTISNFEALCHVTIVYDTHSDDDEMVDALRAGNTEGYDLVFPETTTAFLLRGESLLRPLNFANIPNFANIDDVFKNRTFDPGNIYTVLYLWGSVGIGYRKSAVQQPITSWNDLFQAKVRVAWINDNRLMLGAALNMLGLDPNTTNQPDLDKASAYLIGLSANVVAIADDTGQDLLVEGQADIVIEYSGDIFQVIDQCRCDDYAYVIPQEGAYSDLTSMAIPYNAPNAALAETFIDYILDPQVGADIANYTVYGSPNRVAVEQGLIYEQYLTNPSIYPPREVLSKMYALVSSDEIETLFADTWDKTRAALGK